MVPSTNSMFSLIKTITYRRRNKIIKATVRNIKNDNYWVNTQLFHEYLLTFFLFLATENQLKGTKLGRSVVK